MRQGQQSRRGRGRGSNNNNSNQGNRKGQNPLTRSFESNGPDMKIRGTPAHIAEKYMALARDAQSSGDHVLAENYLQHAEHYNRIILAYREQQLSQGGGDPNLARPRAFNESMEGGDEFGDEGGGDFVDPAQQAQPRVYDSGQPGMQPQPQPRSFDQPRFDDRQGGREQFNRRDRGDRQDRGERQDRGDRDGRQDRFESRGERQERGDRGQDRQDRGDRSDRFDRQGGEPRGEGRGFQSERASQPAAGEPADTASAPRERRRERFPQHHEQPEFLRRSVRRPRREASSEGGEEAPAPVTAGDEPRQD